MSYTNSGMTLGMIPCGEKVILELPDENVVISANFIGMLPSSLVLLHIPHKVRPIESIGKKLDVVFKYSCGSRVFGFRSRVLKVVPDIKTVVLKYPKQVEDLTPVRFKSDRVASAFPCVLSPEDLRLRGVIANISMGGCRIRVDGDAGADTLNVSTGAIYRLLFNMPGRRGELTASLLVTQSGLSEDYYVSGKFTDLGGDALKAISEYVCSS